MTPRLCRKQTRGKSAAVARVQGGKVQNNDLFIPLVLRYFTCAHIIPPPYSRDSSFQRGSISKLDTGVGPVPQDEGKPIPSGIWETVTTVPNEDTGYGYWNGVQGVGRDQKSRRRRAPLRREAADTG